MIDLKRVSDNYSFFTAVTPGSKRFQPSRLSFPQNYKMLLSCSFFFIANYNFRNCVLHNLKNDYRNFEIKTLLTLKSNIIN